jgi:hypothetical protein
VRHTLTTLNSPHGSFRNSRANIATNTGTLNTTTCNRKQIVNNQQYNDMMMTTKAMIWKLT